jgi:hypothetical protein
MRYLELKIKPGQIRTFCYLVLGLVCIFFTVILPSCGESGTRILYSGSKVGDQICASYELFTGVDKKTFIADEGDRIVFSYFSSVEKGRLKMEIFNPDNILITSFSSNKTRTQELNIEKSGKHTVMITGNQTKGRYQISWNRLN